MDIKAFLSKPEYLLHWRKNRVKSLFSPSVARRPWFTIIVFLIPALFLYFGFILYPVLRTFYSSFHTLDMAHGMVEEYVGISHYGKLLTQDKTFQMAAQHSLIWGFVSPLLEIPLALVLAMVLYRRPLLDRLFRVAWFSPILLSYVVVGIIWRWVYNYDWGVANLLLASVGLQLQNWLGDIHTALPSLIIVSTWMFTGFNMVILLAGLHSLPEELIDAARIDGANNFRLLWHVIVPLLRGTIVNLLILCFIGKMKLFDLVWVMTRGGPMWATETVATYVIKRAFHWRTLDLGYPSAVAVLWFIIIFLLSLLFTRLLNRQDTLEF
jgi:ABC-type sugar transport system permease subunit